MLVAQIRALPVSGKNVVSYGLYGANPKYVNGAIRNAELVKVRHTVSLGSVLGSFLGKRARGKTAPRRWGSWGRAGAWSLVGGRYAHGDGRVESRSMLARAGSSRACPAAPCA